MKQTRFKNAYVLNVMSHDRPGIVASVGEAIQAIGGNIDACSQTVLSDYFTLIMIVSFQESIEPEALATHVRGPNCDEFSFQVVARPFHPEAGRRRESAERFVVTAFGEDKPGILLRFTHYLADKDINVIDMYGDLKGDEFVLIAQVEVPRRWPIGVIRSDLQEIGRQQGYTVHFQHENIFVATNQLRFTQTQE